jgi:hypothetical protein
MEEEKKKRKIKREGEELISDYESSSDEKEEVIIPKVDVFVPKVTKSKKSFIVVLVTPTMVIYRVGKDSNSFTPNVWGDKLKVGDEIYL